MIGGKKKITQPLYHKLRDNLTPIAGQKMFFFLTGSLKYREKKDDFHQDLLFSRQAEFSEHERRVEIAHHFKADIG